MAAGTRDEPTVTAQPTTERHALGKEVFEPPAPGDQPALSAADAVNRCYSDNGCYRPEAGTAGKPEERLVRYTDYNQYSIGPNYTKTQLYNRLLAWVIVWPSGTCQKVGGPHQDASKDGFKCIYIVVIDANSGNYIVTTTVNSGG